MCFMTGNRKEKEMEKEMLQRSLVRGIRGHRKSKDARKGIQFLSLSVTFWIFFLNNSAAFLPLQTVF